MASRQVDRYPELKLNATTPPPPRMTTPSPEPQSAQGRPLSDIREITEPSLLLDEPSTKRNGGTKTHQPTAVQRQSSFRQADSVRRRNSVRIVEPSRSEPDMERHREIGLSSSSEGDAHEGSSVYSIPPSNVPPRSSSRPRRKSRPHHFSVDESLPLQAGVLVPNRGHSDSPVKQSGVRLDAVSSDSSRRIPSRTFIRLPCSSDILEHPNFRHPRVSVGLQVVAPLFVGGGSIEGYVHVVVEDVERSKQKKTLSVSSLEVDLIGVEELVTVHRQSIFLSLATHLLNDDHPPPRDMADSSGASAQGKRSWTLRPSSCLLPFRISLPLETGPAPFQSRNARIRYILCATMVVDDLVRSNSIRSSQEIKVLSTYDPERALRSLPSPLTAYDEHILTSSGRIESVKVTAGLHRQVWVSGTGIFVDVHIVNNSRKSIKRLDLALERDILCYRHAAATTLEMSASQARIFEDKEQATLIKSTLKQGQGWDGVDPYSAVVKTLTLDIPRDHASIKCGKYFEVRFFLNVSIGKSRSKLVCVQLPIILIHINSLDVVPNAVSQVAAAIAEKRNRHGRSWSQSNTHGHSEDARHGRQRRDDDAFLDLPAQLQGRAFAAPRQQSLDRIRAQAEDVEQLGHILERSPRKHRHGPAHERTVSRRNHKQAAEAKSTTRRQHEPMPMSRPSHDIHPAPSSYSLGGISLGSYTAFNGNIFDDESPTNSCKRVRDRDAEVMTGGLGDQIGNFGRFEALETKPSTLSLRSIVMPRSKTPTTHLRPPDLPGTIYNPAQKSREKETRRKSTEDSRNRSPRAALEDLEKPSKDNGQIVTHLGPYTLGLQPSPLRPRAKQKVGFSPDLEQATNRPAYGQHLRPEDPPMTTRRDNTRDAPSRTKGTGSVARRTSFRIREQVDRSRFEFKAVRRKGSGGLRDWWERRSKSKERDKLKEGWI